MGVIDSSKVCNNTHICITCSAIENTMDLSKDTDMGAGADIVHGAGDFKEKIEKMDAKEWVGFW
eukprot:7655079-Heterocapsa_arctica.AAC.1